MPARLLLIVAACLFVVVPVACQWWMGDGRSRRRPSQFVKLTAQRRATLDDKASQTSQNPEGSAPPGATVALSLHRRNGRPIPTEDQDRS